MQSAIVFVALLAAASATTLQYVPQVNSAVVSSQRVGGNFAYTVGQQPAYAYTVGQQPAYAYTAGQQPAYAYTAGYPYNAYNTPVVYTSGVQAAGVVPTVNQKVATAYTYQAPVSTVVAGTPAATYKTVAGVSPLAYNTLGYNNVVGYNGYNGLGYSGLAGYPGYATVY